LVHVLECDILRHGVDLLALGLRRFGLGFGVRGLELAHAVARECDPVGVVDDPVENRVGERRIADDLVPAELS
jgi:hypothetical protein